MMKHFFASSVLDADNKMECGQCARRTAVEKRVLLTKAPPYLVCTIKRMDFDFKAQKSIKFLHQVMAVDGRVEEERAGRVGNGW